MLPLKFQGLLLCTASAYLHGSDTLPRGAYGRHIHTYYTHTHTHTHTHLPYTVYEATYEAMRQAHIYKHMTKPLKAYEKAALNSQSQ